MSTADFKDKIGDIMRPTQPLRKRGPLVRTKKDRGYYPPAVKPSPEISAGRFMLKLRSVGNPDHRQYAAISEPATVFVHSMREAVEVCMKYITEWDLGGGNWPPTYVLENGKKVARISYNGRVWEPTADLMAAKEIKL